MRKGTDSIRIAKALLRIARTLVAENVADAAGDYRDFTGIIDWHQNTGMVDGATFTLKGDKSIDWKYGTWEDGNWHDGTWEYGTWEDGNWEKGTWENGNWEKGTWEDGDWKYGNWEDGLWMNGVWEEGTGPGKNKYHYKGDSPDKWR